MFVATSHIDIQNFSIVVQAHVVSSNFTVLSKPEEMRVINCASGKTNFYIKSEILDCDARFVFESKVLDLKCVNDQRLTTKTVQTYITLHQGKTWIILLWVNVLQVPLERIAS